MNEYEERDKTLREMGYSDYKAYLKSPLWRDISERVLKTQPTCRVCGRPSEVVHHRSYYRTVLEGTLDSLLVALCHDCHHHIEFDEGHKTSVRGANVRLDRAVARAKNLRDEATRKQRVARRQERRAANRRAASDAAREQWRERMKGETVVLTEAMLDRAIPKSKTITREQAEALGVPYPPLTGWRKRLIGARVPKEAIEEIIRERLDKEARRQELARLEREKYRQPPSNARPLLQFQKDIELVAVHNRLTVSWPKDMNNGQVEFFCEGKRVLAYWPSSGRWLGEDSSGKVLSLPESLELAIEFAKKVCRDDAKG